LIAIAYIILYFSIHTLVKTETTTLNIVLFDI